MNKERFLLFVATTMVIGLSVAFLSAKLKTSDQASRVALSAPNVQQINSVEYYVGRVIRSSNEPYEVTVIISIEPKQFTRDEMLKLARQLKQEFPDTLLRVEILDDKNIAANFIPAGDMYHLFNKAKRGTYVLNRNTGQEYIEFSTARGKPTNQVKINLQELNDYPLSSITSLSEVPTVSFCNLLANPGAYNTKVIRVQAILVVNRDYRALYDTSCITKEPMVSVEPDSSLHYEPGDAVPEKLYELVLRPESEIKEASARVVMVGRFEGPNFRKDGRISRFQHRFIVMHLETAESLAPSSVSSAQQAELVR